MKIEEETFEQNSIRMVDAYGWDLLSTIEKKDSLLAALEWNNKQIKREGYTRYLLDIRDQIINDLNLLQKEMSK